MTASIRHHLPLTQLALCFSTSSVYPHFFLCLDWQNLSNKAPLYRAIYWHTHYAPLPLFIVIHLPALMLHLLYPSSYVIITDTSSSDVYGSLNSPFRLMSLWIGAQCYSFTKYLCYIFDRFSFLFFMCILLWQPWFSRDGFVRLS